MRGGVTHKRSPRGWGVPTWGAPSRLSLHVFQLQVHRALDTTSFSQSGSNAVGMHGTFGNFVETWLPNCLEQCPFFLADKSGICR